MKLKSVIMSAAIAAASTVIAAPNYHCTFSYNGYAGESTLENFPVLIKLAKGSPRGFDYSQVNANLYDLCFKDANGNRLKYEIEKWDATGTSYVWVQVPSFDASTTVTAWWGDPDATIAPAERTADAIWRDCGYAGVWHMNEATAGADAVDASGNGLTAVAGGADTSEMVSTAGAIGGARTIASTAIVNYFQVSDTDALNALGTRFTIGAWFKATAIKSNGRVFNRKSSWDGSDGWEIQWNSSTVSIPSTTPRGSSKSNDGAASWPSLDNWVNVVWVFDGTNVSTYANGVLKKVNTIVEVKENTYPLYFNNSAAYIGAYDEVRLVGAVRSADWIQASYATVSGRGFCSVGKVIDESNIGADSFATQYSSLVSVAGYTAAETLYNVPVLVKIAENSLEGFLYTDVQENGTDILFTDADGNVIPHEIEMWNPEGTSFVWVNLPELKKGTMFRFCYGNSEVTTSRNTPSDVWYDRGYAGVWHLGETATTGAESSTDSTVNGNTAISGGAATNEMVSTEGIAGMARTIASSAVINYLSVADDYSLDLGDTFTFSCWMKASAITGNGRIMEKKGGNWNNPGWEAQWAGGSTVASPAMTLRGGTSDNNGQNIVNVGTSLANWTQLTFVYHGLDIDVYVNGKYVGYSPITKTACKSTHQLRFASGAIFKGAYDEVRLIGGALSASRIKVEYDAMASDSFLSFGKVAAAGEANVFTVESADTQRGTVSPAWGKTENLNPGEMTFSAPSGTIATEDETLSFQFTGYSLFVTANGVERLAETSINTTGTYTHVAGQSARLMWRTVDMPQVLATPTAGGTVTGSDYVIVGSTVTLTATPDDGYRFVGWQGALPEGVSSIDTTISFIADKAYSLTAKFAPNTVTTAFFGWSGHDEGEPVSVETAANTIGTETFAPTAVSLHTKDGTAPKFSKLHPAKTIYTDSLMNEVLTTDPGSVYFTDGSSAEIAYGTLGSWITRQQSCTIEFFYLATVGGQYNGVYSMSHEGDNAVVFAPNDTVDAVRYSVEKSSNGHKDGGTKLTLDSAVQYAWHHLALIYDRDAQTVTICADYKLGTPRATKLVATEEAVPLCIGSAYANSNDTGHPYRGWISCLRVTKGALEPREMMRADSGEPTADGTIAFYDFRGAAGAGASGVKPLVGDRETFLATAGCKANQPVFTNDVPDTAIYANAAAVAAKTPLTKRHAALYFDMNSDLTLAGLSSSLSGCDEYTFEMFVKPEYTGLWMALCYWNDGGADFLQLPSGNSTQLTLQTKSNGKSASGQPGTTALADGNWHHLAVTYASATGKYTVFYDRKSVCSISAYGRSEVMVPFNLGSNYALDNSKAFLGMVTGLRLSNRVLTTDEFLVAAPKPPSGLSLIVK